MPADDLKRDIVANGHCYSFFQALRLLDLIKSEEQLVTVRPTLSLGFPAGDICAVDEVDDGYIVEGTFLGLYGSGSPLPAFYTEELLEEAAADQDMMRGFYEIPNSRMYDLLFRCWEKSRLSMKVFEKESATDVDRLFALAGLDWDTEKHQLLRYAGLLSQKTRSACGLEVLLQDAFRGLPVRVIQCVPREVEIPPDQRLSLGATAASLGEDAVLGATIGDASGSMEIVVGPVGYADFQSFFPAAGGRERMKSLVDTYLSEPLKYEITCFLKDEETRPVELGAMNYSRLGYESWL